MEIYISKFLDEYKDVTFENNFIPMLICYLLRNIEHEEIIRIRQEILDKILSRRRDGILLNYDESGRYPDDLDDIFTGLIAIHFTNPKLLTGETFDKLSKLLLNQSNNPGGPYQTWLQSKWSDTDVVVNSTISYFLDLYKINLVPLTNYLDNHFESKYYTSEHVKYYFLSRGYKGNNRSTYIERVRQLKCNNKLEETLKATSLINFGEKIEHFSFGTKELGVDLYIDKGKTYAGSEVLTYAFILELYSLIEKGERSKLGTKIWNPLSEVTFETDPRINKFISKSSSLDRLTGLGWLSYSMIDDIVDGDLAIEKFYDVQQVNFIFFESLFDKYKTSRERERLRKIFNTMHAANIWELKNCRDLEKLPRFRKNRHHSGYKSIGMMVNAPDLGRETYKYYRDFLILKQLNDDMHDWKIDMDRGHITHANIGVIRAKKKFRGINIDEYYWTDSMGGLIKRYHIYLKKLDEYSKDFLGHEIDRLRKSLQTLELERDYYLTKYKS